jgi:hypothetical protein
VNPFTAPFAGTLYTGRIAVASGPMQINFEKTMTEPDFKEPLLDANEQRLAREIQGDADFAVDGLARSFLSRLLTLFGVGR